MTSRRINRVLFLNPPDPALLAVEGAASYLYFEPPLGLLYVYDFIKRRGDLTVRFVDLNIEMQENPASPPLEKRIRELMHDFRPDMVCIAALYYSAIDTYHRTAAAVREAAPEAVVVMGGHYPTHLTQACLESAAAVDYALLSEGELSLSQLIDALNVDEPLEKVQGLAWRENGTVRRNVRTSFWKGFSEHDRLPWEDTNFRRYYVGGRNVLERVRSKSELRIAAVTASRGCPNNCGFCSSPSFWRRRWRKRRVELIVAEIRFLMEQYGINTIVFNDENIAAHRGWFLELLNALIPLKITWISSGGLSVRCINDDTVLEKMFASGVGFFNLAAESGNNATLRKVNKPLAISETLQTVSRIRSFGQAYIIGFFIVGFPFESWSNVESTLAFAGSLDLDWRSFYCFQPFPGSELHDYCLKTGQIKHFDPSYKEVYFAADVVYDGYTSDELGARAYAENLRQNFLWNKNLLRGDQSGLEQAERDFRYVLDMVPEHLFALHGLARIADRRQDSTTRNLMLRRARHALREAPALWARHATAFNLDLHDNTTEL